MYLSSNSENVGKQHSVEIPEQHICDQTGLILPGSVPQFYCH